MGQDDKKVAENLAKIREDIAALSRRLKVSAEKRNELRSDTDRLLKSSRKPRS